MIEDDLKAMMTDRVTAAPTNPRRPTQLRRRIRSHRRRVAGGGVLGLIVVLGTGAALTRLPGPATPLPAASKPATDFPPGPYFVDPVSARAVGYTSDADLRLDGPTNVSLPIRNVQYTQVIVVRCPQAGNLTVRNLGAGGPRVAVACRDRQGDHFEGSLVLPEELIPRLYAPVPRSADNVRLEPGTAGSWTVGLLVANATEPLPPWTGSKPPLLEGWADGAAREFGVTIPRPAGEQGLRLWIDCVAGVQLQLTIGDAAFATANCDPTVTSPDGRGGLMHAGRVLVSVPATDLDRLDLRAGSDVTITVRSTGRQTDQWRITELR